MKHVHKTVLLWYSPHEMHSLVTRINDYPTFLPWCESAEVIEQHDDGVTARLGLNFAGMRHSFTTRNHHVKDTSVLVELVDGPFSVLDGSWAFLPVGDDGETNDACKIEFDLRYAFAGNALEGVLSPVFDRIANTLVDSFVARAESVYGAR
jgi:ribosome-associated toxin RatA of RatAB toxin-antitoxin module